MRDDLKALAAAILREYAEVLGNAGCNDFRDEWMPLLGTKARARLIELARAGGDDDFERVEDIPDFLVAEALAAELDGGVPMTAPRPEAEAVEIVEAIFDEIDLHAHNAPPCEADCACCAEIRQDWIKRLDAALTDARKEQRAECERLCQSVADRESEVCDNSEAWKAIHDGDEARACLLMIRAMEG